MIFKHCVKVWGEDLVYLLTNKSYMLSTLAFTCLTFCTGALSWFGPYFIEKGLKVRQQNHLDGYENDFSTDEYILCLLGVPTSFVKNHDFFREIEGRSVVFRWNENKLFPNIFASCDIWKFLLNSCPKLVIRTSVLENLKQYARIINKIVKLNFRAKN